MDQDIEKTITLTIDDIDYDVNFVIEASFNNYPGDEYEHFGAKGRTDENEWEFELLELLSITDSITKTEITITKELERKVRAELHEWISANSDTLCHEVSNY